MIKQILVQMSAALLFCSSGVLALTPPPGEWLEAHLGQIEMTPSEGWVTGPGIWFAASQPYVTNISCPHNRYISIRDGVLADRALSAALYAKSSGGKVKVYVSGCDVDGYLQGLSVMLVD